MLSAPRPLLVRCLALLALLAGLAVAPTATQSASAAVATTDACGVLVAKSTGGYWSCSFVDDFSGKSLDTSKWNVQNTALSGYALNATCFRGGNVALRSGTAVLSVTRSANASDCAAPAGSFSTQYTGADINTSGKFSQTNGRFEVRMKYPSYAGAGYQGGFWMNPQNRSYGAWPASGEIDTAEWYSQYADRVLPNLHYTGSTTDDMGQCAVANAAAWHTYTVEWSLHRMDYFVDGTLCHSRTWLPSSPLTNPAPFDKPFFLDLTAGVGGGANAPTSATPFPAAITVDYARAWR